MTGPGVGILVEVHQDVLNLGLLSGVHYHDNGLPRGQVGALLRTSEILAASTAVLGRLLLLGRRVCSIVSREGLRCGASPSFLSCLFASRGALHAHSHGDAAS